MNESKLTPAAERLNSDDDPAPFTEAYNAAMEAAARIEELEARLNSARRGEPRVVLEASQEDMKATQARIEELENRVAHWQEEYRDAISRWQQMTEERNGLREILVKALPIVQSEADTRQASGLGDDAPYIREFADLADEIGAALTEKEPS